MSKFTPFLWFDHEAEEAARFYTSTFKKARLGEVMRYGQGGPGAPGSVMTASFEIDGQPFVALNGRRGCEFTEAVSFMVHGDTQAEADELRDRLLAGGGRAQPGGWLKDRYGVSWQVMPRPLRAAEGR